MPFSLSVSQSPGVLLLNPYFCSSRNCSHHSKGSPGIESSTPAKRMNNAWFHTDSGPPHSAVSLNIAGKIFPNSTSASTSVSKISVSTPKRDFSSV